MTCEAGKTGRDAASVASRPGSVDAALNTLFAQLWPVVYQWAGEQRIEGALQAHDSFDGILSEHVLALEEIRDDLRHHAAAAMAWPGAREAIQKLDEQIRYVRALGTIAGPATDQEEKDAE